MENIDNVSEIDRTLDSTVGCNSRDEDRNHSKRIEIVHCHVQQLCLNHQITNETRKKYVEWKRSECHVVLSTFRCKE